MIPERADGLSCHCLYHENVLSGSERFVKGFLGTCDFFYMERFRDATSNAHVPRKSVAKSHLPLKTLGKRLDDSENSTIQD